MDIKFWTAQLMGGFGIILFVIMYHSPKMKGILKIKLLMDIFWAIHYFLLGAYTGSVTNIICITREGIFMNNDKKVFRSRFWLYLYVLIFLCAALRTWQGWYSILPAAVSTLATFSFWQKNVTMARVIGVTNNIFMFTYDIFVGSYMGLIGESLAFLSIVTALIHNRNNKKAA